MQSVTENKIDFQFKSQVSATDSLAVKPYFMTKKHKASITFLYLAIKDNLWIHSATLTHTFMQTHSRTLC